MVASVAPSFAGHFSANPGEILRRLASLGFSAVEETASAIPLVSEPAPTMPTVGSPAASPARSPDGPPGDAISAACPRVVALVRNEFPHLAGRLSPKLSALAAHCQDIRRRYGPEALVVFFGPCLYKAWERQWSPDSADLVVTFGALRRLLAGGPSAASRHAAWRNSPGDDSDQREGASSLRLAGAWERAAVAATGVSGLRTVRQILAGGWTKLGGVELLGCRGGCLAGPRAVSPRVLAERRARVLRWAAASAAPALTTQEPLPFQG